MIRAITSNTGSDLHTSLEIRIRKLAALRGERLRRQSKNDGSHWRSARMLWPHLF